MGEDIREVLKQWKEESGAKGIIQFKHSYYTNILTIYTAYPGYMIGKSGCHVYKYTEILKNLIHDLDHIEFIQTDNCYIM